MPLWEGELHHSETSVSDEGASPFFWNLAETIETRMDCNFGGKQVFPGCEQFYPGNYPARSLSLEI